MFWVLPIRRFPNGKRESYPDITIIPALAEVLQISIDELLTGKPANVQNVSAQNQLPFTKEEILHEYAKMKPVSVFLTVIGVILSFCFWIAWQSFAWSFGVCAVLTVISLFCRYVAFYEIKNKLKRIDDKSVDVQELKAKEYTSLLWIVWIGITPLCFMLVKTYLIRLIFHPAPGILHTLASWMVAVLVSVIIIIALKRKAKKA